MPPEAVAAAIAHAIDQPDGVNVGEIVCGRPLSPDGCPFS
jgi:NADP-dependent 3-hydroxy acid dehydrogenase YdfG